MYTSVHKRLLGGEASSKIRHKPYVLWSQVCRESHMWYHSINHQTLSSCVSRRRKKATWCKAVWRHDETHETWRVEVKYWRPWLQEGYFQDVFILKSWDGWWFRGMERSDGESVTYNLRIWNHQRVSYFANGWFMFLFFGKHSRFNSRFVVDVIRT